MKEYEKVLGSLKENEAVPSPFKESKSFKNVVPRMIMINTKWTL